MADKNRDTSDAFDFGIIDTSVMGDMKAVESLLSGEPIPLDEEELEDAEEKEEEKPASKKKPATKTTPIKKEEPKKTAGDFTFDEEEEEEDEKEEKSEEEKSKEETSEEPKEEEETPQNDFELLSKDLIKLGVFTQESEDDPIPKTPDELLAKFNYEKQKGASQWIDGILSRYGDDRRDLFEAIYINGVDPKEYLPIYVEVQNLESLDMTKEENQERVYREFYRRIKLDPEKIDVRVQRAKDNGELEEDSKGFHQQIIDQDKEILEEQEHDKLIKKQQSERADAEYKTAIVRSLEEKMKGKEFNGIPLTEELKNKAYDFLYTKRYKTADGQFLTEFDKFVLETKRPENLEQRIMVALLKLTNFDFSKIAKRAVSKESNELFTTFAQKKAKKASTTTSKAATAAAPSDWLNV